MAGEWQEYSIDDLKASTPGAIAIGPFGSRMKSNVYVDSGIPVIRGNNISSSKNLEGDFVFISPEMAKSLGSSNVYDGDLVFPHRGAIGEVGIVTGGSQAHYVLSTSLMKLTCNKELVEPLFLFYFFRSAQGRHELLKNASTVGTPGIATPLTSLRQIRLSIPPLETQRAIAHILGTLDDKIELNRRTNQTLEEMARVLFKSWFVDFDPVRAKAKGRQPEGMDAQTAALFPDGFVDSELGEIPRGWRVSTIGAEVEVVGGSTPSTKEMSYWDGDIHWATPKDLSNLSAPVLLDTERKITPDGLGQISSGLLPKGTVLLSSRAPIGYLAVAEIPVAINQGFIAMKCTRSLSSWYVLNWAYENMEIIKGRSNGTTFLEVSKTNFRPMPVLVPNNAVVAAFDGMVSDFYKKIIANLKEALALAVLRDSLLPRLLSGELTVGEAERALEEASA